MPAPAMPPLVEWESFYVIVGSSAAALTGLMFVVIALGAEKRTAATSVAFRAFATPTVVHFGAVLLLAAFVTTPRHTIASLRACLFVSAVGGLVYASWVIVQARRQDSYVPVLSDWVWHAGLPGLAYPVSSPPVCCSRDPPRRRSTWSVPRHSSSCTSASTMPGTRRYG